MLTRRPLLTTLALAATAMLLLAATAFGAATYKTTISMSEKFPAFHGKLHSSYASCTQNRKVKLYREKGGPDKLLGTTTSAADGTWSIPIGDRLIGGSYYSTVTAKTSSETGVTCNGAMSKIAVVD